MNNVSIPRWHVLGAGAIGGLWAARLAQAEIPVTLLLKNRCAVERFDESPLRLESASGIDEPEVHAVAAIDCADHIDFLLVTTKAYATLDALAALEPRLAPTTHILLLQNGIGIQQQVAERYSNCAVVAGTTTEGAYRRAPFHVVHAGRGQTRFGAVNRVPAASIETLRRCFVITGFDASWVDDIWPPIWRKVAVNCCVNALSAVRRCRNGELLESAEAMATMRGLAAEVEQVMAASTLGFSLPRLFDDVIAVIEATADNYSSMYQDLSRGQRTEIEYINGYICARGDELGVATPLNRQLLHAVRQATG